MHALLYALPIITQPVLEVLLDNVAIYGRSLLRKALDGRDDFEKLRRSALDVARCVLDRAEEHQYASDPLAMSRLSRLKEVIYETEYVLLDNHNCGTRVRNPGRVTSTLSRLETAVDGVLKLHIPNVNVDRERRETSHFVRVSEVHGRDEDKTNIVSLLLPDSSGATTQREDHVPCVIIEGMTAIGKTTLAQLVYNDEVVTQEFTAKAWVFVSHHFDAKKILAAVIASTTRSPCSFSDLSALHTEIERLLNSERHLIVLDDVCTDKVDDWEKLRPLFQGRETKSTILITTQNKRVADTLDVSQHLRYNLNGLSEDQCCYLLKQHAFGPGEERLTLARIGQEIARKCGGVALAAKSLGSLLRNNREERVWLRIRDDDLWNWDERESGILPALRLSYSRLPAHLRRCFACCSIFPRGYEINKEKLIHLWMAEGLIYYDHNTQRSFQAEDTGNKYFNDLLNMSFFEEEKRSDDGAATGYKMHDAIYNLARFVVKSEYAILGHDVPAPTDFRKLRHSSVVRAFRSPSIPDEVYNATGLLTFFLLSGGNFLRVPENLFLKFGYLHVLNLSGSGLEVLEGSSLSRLVHLRLLDLSYTHIRVLPTEIKHLHYLHTLNLFHCYNLQSLSLEDIKQVKHLNNAGCKALFKMTSVQSTAIRWSLSLERLPLFVIFWPKDVGILVHLNLRGNLKILQLRKVPNDPSFPPDYQCLMHMSMLESLGLFWGDDDHRQNINPDEESVVTESEQRKQTHSSGSSSVQAGSPNDPILLAQDLLSHLHPPPFLKRLVISRYPGREFPWDVPRCLNVIHLIGCVNIQHLPLLIEKECGKEEIFPDVKELALIDFPTLETWSSNLNVANAFPSLRKLIISNCPHLIVIPADLNSIRHLELRHCKATLVHSFQGLTSLETLVIDGVDDLRQFPMPFPGNNPHLTSLEIKHCSQLLYLPEEMENLTGLKSLTIRGCNDLTNFPICLYKLTALESLEISDCPDLVSLPIVRDGGFSNLRNLSIESCNNLSSWPTGFRHLTSLERLSIQFCSNLALPLGIEHLSSLRSLTIKGCENLTSLPVGLKNLNTMHSLEIRNCPDIQALPDWIGELTSLRSLVISGCQIASLPQGITSLVALQHLTIHDCPGLVERCRQGSGEDWPKISHVPHRYIEGEQFMTQN